MFFFLKKSIISNTSIENYTTIKTNKQTNKTKTKTKTKTKPIKMKFQVTALFTTLSMIAGSVYGLNTNTAGDLQIQAVKNIGLGELNKLRDANQEAHKNARETTQALIESGVQLPKNFLNLLEQTEQSKYDLIEQHLTDIQQTLGEFVDLDGIQTNDDNTLNTYNKRGSCNVACVACQAGCATATAPIVLPCMGACSVVCFFPNKACTNCQNGCLALTHKCMKECEGL